MRSAPLTSPGHRFHGRVVNIPLAARSRPEAGTWHEHRAADGRTAFVSTDVLDQARAIEHEHAPFETGGLLLGRAFIDGEGPYVLVTYAVSPLRGEVRGTVSTVELTHAGSDAMRRRGEASTPTAEVVGWYHTHPRYEAYFSVVDRTEQAAWTERLAVGLVVSGLPGGAYAIYLGPDAAEAIQISVASVTASRGQVTTAATDSSPRFNGTPATRESRDDVRDPPPSGDATSRIAPAPHIGNNRIAVGLSCAALLAALVAIALALQRDGSPAGHDGSLGGRGPGSSAASQRSVLHHRPAPAQGFSGTGQPSTGRHPPRALPPAYGSGFGTTSRLERQWRVSTRSGPRIGGPR
jgi:proteasome lid subunit RPN8/RPN11